MLPIKTMKCSHPSRALAQVVCHQYSQNIKLCIVNWLKIVLRYWKVACETRSERILNYVEILQLRAKFLTAMVSCSRIIWITNSSDHRGFELQISCIRSSLVKCVSLV